MDAETEVSQRISAINGHTAMLVMLVEQGPAAKPPLHGLIRKLAERAADAKQAVLMRREEREVREAVCSLVDAAAQALGACRAQVGDEQSPCHLIDQIHREAQDLQRQLHASDSPMQAEGSSGPQPV